jgi:transcriptional regulator with XRE-family HTH domain
MTESTPRGEQDDECDLFERRALGAALVELRARRRLTQRALGARVGLHQNYMSAVEVGEKNVGFRSLRRLAEGLAVSLSEMMLVYERQRVERRQVERR